MVTHANLNTILAKNLAADLGTALKKRGFKLALAESCTGGMASQYITAISGSSAWFDCGYITYSNVAKQNMLGVLETTLNQHGAVSEAVALEMVVGALKNSGADIAASITGVAGPDGGTETKPVGMVCFGFALKDELSQTLVTCDNQQMMTQTKQFDGDRDVVRHQSVIHALETLITLTLSSNL